MRIYEDAVGLILGFAYYRWIFSVEFLTSRYYLKPKVGRNYRIDSYEKHVPI
jgi:hypothetical protein